VAAFYRRTAGCQPIIPRRVK